VDSYLKATAAINEANAEARGYLAGSSGGDAAEIVALQLQVKGLLAATKHLVEGLVAIEKELVKTHQGLTAEMGGLRAAFEVATKHR
jgi:hypothetical protein